MSDPYAPPGKIDDDPQMPDDELDALKPGWKVRVAWMALAGSGFLMVLSAVQLLITFTFVDLLLKAVPFAMIVLGVISFPIAAKLRRMHGWAAIGSIVLGALITAGMVLWILFAASRGVISFMQLVVPAVSGATTVFSIMTLGACRLADEARRRLADTGIDARF
jgi:hypothetical protein